MSQLNKKDMVKYFLDKGILLSPDCLDSDLAEHADSFDSTDIGDGVILDAQLCDKNVLSNIDWLELDSHRVNKELHKEDIGYKEYLTSLLKSTFESTQQQDQKLPPFKVVTNYNKKPKKRTYQDFVLHLNKHYKSIESMLRRRQELTGLISISRAAAKKEKESIAVIGMVTNKSTTKNGNIVLELEDATGKINVIVMKNKEELQELIADIQLDEVIGVVGMSADKAMFADTILIPDIPNGMPFKKSPVEEYAVFISDIHYGSKHFLHEEWNRFNDWINGRLGNSKQREIAHKTKYVFVVGDLIEGVGIYPNQVEDLDIKGLQDQYEGCAKLLAQIPNNKLIVTIAGNHDAGRLAEPQLPVYKDYAKAIWDLPNTVNLSNPSMITIGMCPGFPGLDVLVYHGYSFVHYANVVSSILEAGGQKRPDLIMKYLLQRRHLAPTHTSNLYIPDPDEDPLVIEKVPDIFVTGHVHRIAAANYKHVSMLNCSCWVGETDFSEKMGLEPQPARVPIINLQTREITIMNFQSEVDV